MQVPIDLRRQILHLPRLLGVDLLDRAPCRDQVNECQANAAHPASSVAFTLTLLAAGLFPASSYCQDARSIVARAVPADDHSARLARDYTYHVRDEIIERTAAGAPKNTHSTVDEVLYIAGK